MHETADGATAAELATAVGFAEVHVETVADALVEAGFLVKNLPGESYEPRPDTPRPAPIPPAGMAHTMVAWPGQERASGPTRGSRIETTRSRQDLPLFDQFTAGQFIGIGVAIFVACSLVQMMADSTMFSTRYVPPDNPFLDILVLITFRIGWPATLAAVGVGVLKSLGVNPRR